MEYVQILRRVILLVRFNLKGTLSYFIAFIMQIIVIPLIVIIMIYLSLIIYGKNVDIQMIIPLFLVTTVSSIIPVIAQLIGNNLMPDIKDLNASLFGDLRLIIPSMIILNLVYVLPQTMFVVILFNKFDIIPLVLLAYLFTSSVGIYIGAYFKEPFKANSIGTLIYLTLVMLAPMYLTSREIIWQIIPLSVLNLRNLIIIPYVFIVSIILLWLSSKNITSLVITI
jgi:hypothetical protein